MLHMHMQYMSSDKKGYIENQFEKFSNQGDV